MHKEYNPKERHSITAGHYGRYLRVQPPNEPVASGSSKPTADVQELADAKRSRSLSITVAASGKRPKTNIQSTPAIGEKSQGVSFACEYMCGNVDDPLELVADTGRVQKSPDCLAIQSRKQPTYPMQSALVS